MICLNCHQEKQRPHWSEGGCHYSAAEWAKRKFCSQPCVKEYRKKNGSPRNTRTDKKCLECGGLYHVKKYRADIAKYCSVACKVSAQDGGVSTENEKQRKSAAYKLWRTAVFERDDYTCQGCGQHGGYLHADHIKPFALYPESRLELSNGQTLCVPCHKATETYGRTGIFRNVIAVSQEA